MGKIIFEIDARVGDAERKVKQFNAEAEKIGSVASAASAGIGALTVAAGAAGAATIAAAVNLAAYTKELKLSSVAAGQNIETTQKMALALAGAGISLEQFRDMTKDARERVGEFINEGTGEFQVLIDTLGYTKDEAAALAASFKDLSGAEILQKSVQLLEKQGKNATEISAVLEAMASDATLLAPMLADNGAELERMALASAAVSAPLTEEEVDRINEAAESARLLGVSITSYVNKSLADAAPLFKRVSDAAAHFFGSLQEGTGAHALSQLADIDSQIKSITDMIDNAGSGIGRFNNAIGLTAGLSGLKLGDLDFGDAQIKQLEEYREKLKEQYAEMQKEYNESFGVNADANQLDDSEEKSNNSKLDLLKQYEEEAAKIKEGWETIQKNKDAERLAAKATAEEEAHQKKLEDIKRRAEEELMTEEELLQARFEREYEMFAGNAEARSLLEQELQANLSALRDKQAEEEQRRLDREARDSERMYDDKIDAQESSINAAKILNRALFDDNKAVGAGLIVADTAVAVMSEYKTGGLPAALLAGAQGVAQLAALKGASVGGGGAPSVSSATPPAQPQQSGAQAGNISVNSSDISGMNQSVVKVEFDENTDLGVFLNNALNKSRLVGLI